MTTSTTTTAAGKTRHAVKLGTRTFSIRADKCGHWHAYIGSARVESYLGEQGAQAWLAEQRALYGTPGATPSTCSRCGGQFPTRTSGITPGALQCYDAASCDRNLRATSPAAAAVAAAHADADAPVEQDDARELARGYVQTIPSDLLAAVLRGDVNLNALASAELASRGLDASGQWVGFAAAAVQHDMRTRTHAVVRGDGRVVRVTVPE